MAEQKCVECQELYLIPEGIDCICSFMNTKEYCPDCGDYYKCTKCNKIEHYECGNILKCDFCDTAYHPECGTIIENADPEHSIDKYCELHIPGYYRTKLELEKTHTECKEYSFYQCNKCNNYFCSDCDVYVETGSSGYGMYTKNYYDCYRCLDEQTKSRLLELKNTTEIRENRLKSALKHLGLKLRDDSRLCYDYIENNVGDIDEIVQTMCEMKYLFDYCQIRSVMKKLKKENEGIYVPFEFATEICLQKTNGYPDFWPWLKKEKLVNVPANTECKICYESCNDKAINCKCCNNKICLECYKHVNKCAFCRYPFCKSIL